MKNLFEIGFFSVFYNWSSWPLTAAAYFCVLTGFFIEHLILRRNKTKAAKWIYPAILLIACIIGEALTWAITGWNVLAVLIIYGLAISNGIGVMIAALVYQMRRRRS